MAAAEPIANMPRLIKSNSLDDEIRPMLALGCK